MFSVTVQHKGFLHDSCICGYHGTLSTLSPPPPSPSLRSAGCGLRTNSLAGQAPPCFHFSLGKECGFLPREGISLHSPSLWETSIGFCGSLGPSSLPRSDGEMEASHPCIFRAGPFEPTLSNTAHPGVGVWSPGNYISWLTSDSLWVSETDTHFTSLWVSETPRFGSNV